MKFTINLLGCLFLLFVQVFFINEKVGAEENGYRNFYGIAGSGKPSEDIKYARQMGYEYIALNPTSSPEEYHKNPDCTGLKFYLIDPQWYPQILSGHKRNIDISKPVSDEAKEFYNQRMVWKSNDPFPYNLATGYHSTGDSSKFSVMWDFQQQAVIDEVVEQIILLAKSYENQGLSFAFGGYIINEPKLAGEFYRLDEKGINIPVGLSYWTGVNSGLVHDTITHEYATYSEGMAAFYKKLRARLTGEFTNPKWIVQPTALYSESGNDEWIYQIKDRADKDELTPDLLSQGSWLNTNFVDDANNFNSGVNITKDRVGNSQAGEVDEYKNRLFAAKAGVNGAWYNWCGQSGGVGDMSDFKGITEIYPRLKLIRCLPNWDNLNTVPLGDRSWDGSVYKSTKSYANGDIMYSRHPRTGKLFAVFLTLSGAITLNTGELVTSVECANGFFVESGDGSGDVVITGDEIRLKSRKDIGKGYIFTVSAKGDQSTVMVGSESDGTSGSETSDGTVNGRDLSGSAWVEYVSSKVRDGKGISAKAKISQQSGSTQMWQQVAKRTAAQKSLGYLPGEGWQMILYITYAPSDPSIAYFSTDTNQVWRSSDGGTNWTRKGNGFYAFGASSLGVHPTDPNFVLAAGGNFERALQAMDGIYKTTDGGNNWTRVYSAGYYTKSQRGNCFVFTGSTIYAIKSDSGGLISSTNNGNTWSDVSKSGGGVALTGIGAPYDIKLHPADNSILYACTSSGLYRLDISGGIATQTKIGSGLPSAPQRVVFKPGAPYVMYVVLYDHGVYRSSDSGASFNARNSGISTAISSGGKSRNIAISPANPNRLLVALHGLWPSKHVYYSANEGSSWTNTDTMDEKIGTEWVCGGLFQGGWGPDFAGSSDLSPVVAFHPQNELIALTAGWGEMVKKTTNGGVTWKYSNSGYTGAAPAVYSRSHISWDPLNPNRAVFSLLDFGALMTTNNEDTFKSIAVNTYSDTSGAPCIAMRDNIIIKGIGSWFDFSYITDISRDSGVTWTFVYGTEVSGTAEKNALTYNFARFHPQNSNICYVGKFKFTNIQNNNTFVTLTHPIKEIFPGNGNIVYSFSANTVYKSTDAGASWTTPYPPLPSTHYIQSMAVDPTNQNRLYLGCSNYGVYIITDTLAHGGSAIIRNEAHGLAKNAFGSVHTGNVAVDPVSPNVVYAGSYAGSYGLSNGVFRSTDYGLTWTNISGNLGSAFNCTTLQVNPYTRYVYAGGFHGTWKLPPPSSTSTADTSAPNCSININNGNTYTNSGTATLTLSATDDVGVIGYYLSTSSPTPLASAPGWTSVVSTANYSGTVSYTLSSGDGTKTVYVWYKDAAGNVSNAASDSIILDTTVNTVTGLNALYLFDEKSGSTAKDYSGNGNTGILFNGTVWTKGKINNALFFDGVNDYVEVPNSESINPSKAVTVSAWIYPIAPGQSQDSKIISKRHQTLSNDNYSLGFTSTNRPQARVIVGGGPKIINGPVLSLNAWHHLVGVYNGSTLKLYVNGVEVASTTAAGSIDSSTHPLRIGTRAFDPADRYFQGNIDDVRIYSLALSDQEVQDLHRSAEMVTVSMQARYMFEEGAGTIATDLSGNNRNGTITGATWTTGKIGGGLNFDGNDYVTIPRVNYDEISVSAWFNKNTSGTNVIFGGFRYNANVQLQEGFDLYFQSGTPNSLRFAVATRNVSGTTTVKEAIKDFTNSNGSWYHVVGTYNKATGEQKLYVDGQLVNTQVHPSGNVVVPLTERNYMAIGTRYTDWGFFRGSIDDARIYNRMLSAQEVLDLYRSAEMITADTTVPECSISINSGDLYTKSTTVTLSLSATDDVGVTGYYLSTSSSAPLASAPGWTSVVSTADYSGTVSYTLSSGDGTKTVYVWYKDAAGNVSNTASDSVILDTMITASMQARYTFEEGAGTNATDSSGNNRNGTITGATWTTGKIGGGLSFDGNDYVTIPRVNYDEISVSAWFNKNTSGTNVIFGGFRYNADVQLQEGFDLYFQSGTPNNLRFAVATRNVSGTITVKEAIKDFTNSNGSWYHVVGTYNKATGEQKLYVDGQLVNTQAHPSGNVVVPLTERNYMAIGTRYTDWGFFRGSIDDARIYNRMLSAQEVLDLYHGN